MKNQTSEFNTEVTAVDTLDAGINRRVIDGIELVIVTKENFIGVFSGVCIHAGALLANGFLDGEYLTCGSHLWRYHLESGELDGEPGIFLKKLEYKVTNDILYVRADELEDLKDDEFD